MIGILLPEIEEDETPQSYLNRVQEKFNLNQIGKLKLSYIRPSLCKYFNVSRFRFQMAK